MIIGICGHARNGKDSVAHVFKDLWGFEHRSFAKPLKDACKFIFDWSDEEIEGRLKDVEDVRWGITPRLAMQLIGTEFGQYMLCEKSEKFKVVVGRNLWVKRCLDDAGDKNIVISDVRFPHEADAIRSKGGIIIRVIRRGFEGNSLHASEVEMEKIKPDFVIHNDYSLDYLNEEVCNIAIAIGVHR